MFKCQRCINQPIADSVSNFRSRAGKITFKLYGGPNVYDSMLLCDQVDLWLLMIHAAVYFGVFSLLDDRLSIFYK